MPTQVNVTGIGSPFTTDPNITLLNLIKTNWPAGGAFADPDLTIADGKIKLGTTWWDSNPWYQIHVSPHIVTMPRSTLGRGRTSYVDRRAVHLFAKGQSGQDKLYKMKQTIEAIFLLVLTNPGSGILWMNIPNGQPVVEPDSNPPDARQTIFHWVYYVDMAYEKYVS